MAQLSDIFVNGTLDKRGVLCYIYLFFEKCPILGYFAKSGNFGNKITPNGVGGTGHDRW